MPLIIYSQDYFDPISPKQKSKEFLQYIKMIDGMKSTTIRKKVSMNVNDDYFKKLYSLAFFSCLYNPFEYTAQHRNYIKMMREQNNKNYEKNYKIIESMFFHNEDLFKEFEFNYAKYFLYDLYSAPFMFIGTITNVDTVYSRYSLYHIIKYEMLISDNMNKYYKGDVINKKLKFLFSTGHLGRNPNSWIISSKVVKHIPEQKFEIGKKYLIFISASIYEFKRIKNTPYYGLPVLDVTSLGDANFPVEGSEIIDIHGYFELGERVSIKNVKIKIDSIMDENYRWRK